MTTPGPTPGATPGAAAGRPSAPADLTTDLRAVRGTARVPDARAAADPPTRQVRGKIYDQLGNPLPDQDVIAYHLGFQCEGERLGVASTGADGGYTVEYQRDGVVNLQIRTVDRRGDELALSAVKHRAASVEVLNLVCPDSARARSDEYTRLREDLSAQLGRASLADAREDGECGDITLLARSTGWDGRLVALAAHAERLSQQTAAPASVLYALLRLGAPFDARALARLRPETLDRALSHAVEAGVAQLAEADIAAAREALADYARELRLGHPAAPGTLSTVAELLAASGLDADQAQRFDAIVAGHDGPAAAMWDQARAAGISEDTIAGLQVQGKLAQLTMNNAPLMAALGQELGREPMGRALVTRDLHTPQAWQEYLSRLGAPEELVPPAYTGDTAQQRVHVYAEDLARKVRIGLPTHVVARRAETGEFNLDGSADAAQVLYRAADELGFRFGTTATRTFLKQHPELLDGVANPAAVEDALLTMHRVYQMTPDDQAMRVLIDAGITSAQVVTAMEKPQFTEKWAAQVGAATAELIYDKAVLISSVAYNAFAAAQALASTPVVYAVSPSTEVAQQAQQNLASTFPTMAGLFGDLDFCECEHCRSVLSPAAYLVDLLAFLDPPDNVWEVIRAHPNEPKPFQVLTQRRPDLPLLPLTCENTHTVLPYIDVVNEILEFSVAHQGADLPAFDVGLAASDDLLAEPQHLIADAYPLLKDATYPLGLPFDLWLETVRGFLDRLEVPLATLLAQFCPVETLDGAPYGWREVHREQLGLSPGEYALFAGGVTDWHQLYGYPDAGTARTELAAAKTLARRLGVSYQELADLVQTWFVNPNLDALRVLYSLGLNTWQLMRYVNANGVPPFDPAEKAAFEQQAGTHLAWLTDSYANGVFDHIVVLADSDTSCSFEHTAVRYLNSADQLDEVLTRLNLLVRLRRKLGWKLAEVDAALRALLPTGSLGPALAAVLVDLARLHTLTKQVTVGSDTRVALLSLWSTMDPSRYRKLFLRPGMRPEDEAIFDDPHGNYLSNPASLLKDHLPAVRGALNLTADEIKLILGGAIDTAVLDLPSVTLLDRHKVLAKGLRLDVADIITLRELSGVDPFSSTADTARFVTLAGELKRAGLRVSQLDYLIRDSYDPAGPLAPRRDRVLALIRELSTEVDRIRAEHAVPADGLAFTDEIIAQKLPLVLPAEVAAEFLGMWAGTKAADQAFFDANLVAPVGFAAPADFAVLFSQAPVPGDAQAMESWQRDRRHHLAGLFLPFLQERLIQTMLTERLAAEFGADPQLMAGLLTELLALDGGPLLPAFVAAGTHGFTVSYLDNTGAILDTAVSATGAVAAGPVGTTSVRVTGMFEVPTPGPYAFAAGAGAGLALSHLTDPLAAQPDGSFDPVQLQAGKLYELTVTIPGGEPAQLDLVAENLPLGPAGRLITWPAAAVARITTAHELIRKALLVADVLDLGVTELVHLHQRSVDFAGWDLTAPAFDPLLRVCGLALLRDELRARGPELIEIFRQARRTPVAGETPADVRAGVLGRVAVLTRRSLETVTDAADTLGFTDATDLADERGLGKLWRLLAVAKTLGVAPSAVAAWADPEPDEALAASVRTTLKARFELSAWRSTVTPISNRLRQLRRDALVRYLRHRDGFGSTEQLFEHFLVDPGTEPVVQTSRLRLAISSLQTFIQRCLMNLEAQVRPAALSATQWEWMKRYRVWEANRKIFLWPENWLEPEFRDDKSHLFQALEGELLQGDVSQDLAEDAFHHYLSGLDKIARLEIVSTWLQEHELDPANNVLHVVGRTYNKAQEYFYRRYRNGEWSPWEPITAQIESDHVVVTIWRDRPYLFWLTFLERAKEPEGETEFPAPANPPRIVDVQLHWAEYRHGQWSEAEASDLHQPLSAVVSADFDSRDVFMHAAPSASGDDEQVSIYLSTGGAKPQQKAKLKVPKNPAASLYRGFRLVGRNAPVVVLGSGSAPKAPPFSWDSVQGTRYVGSGALTVWHAYRIEKFEGKTTITNDPKQVLSKGGTFSLVIPPRAVDTAGSTDIDSLVRPFFYQDNKHTFYVEPTVIEQVFHEWEDWIITAPDGPNWEIDQDIYWEEVLPIDPWGPIVHPNPPDPISPYARFAIQNVQLAQDPLLAPDVAVQYGSAFIGVNGSMGVEGAVNG